MEGRGRSHLRRIGTIWSRGGSVFRNCITLMRSRIRIPDPHQSFKKVGSGFPSKWIEKRRSGSNQIRKADQDQHQIKKADQDPHQIKKADQYPHQGDADRQQREKIMEAFPCQTDSFKMINNIYTQTQKATSVCILPYVEIYLQNVLKIFRKNYRLSLFVLC